MELKTTLRKSNIEEVLGVLEKWTAPVLSTMGAAGKVVIIGRPEGNIYTLDGITVARNTAPEDAFERMIFRMVVDAAHQTVKKCGDGTTTTTALVLALVREFVKMKRGMAEPGLDVHKIVADMSQVVAEVVKNIYAMAEPIIKDGVINTQALNQVATVSCHNDPVLGGIIGDLIAKVGADGDVTVQESHSGVTYTEYLDGYVSRSGFINPNFINDPYREQCVLENPVVCIADQIIDNTDDLICIYEAYHRCTGRESQNRPLVIICEDMQGGALNTCIGNLPQMGRSATPVPTCVIHCPLSGRRRTDLLQDLALLTGATVFKKIGGTPVSQINRDKTVDPFGRVDKMVADKNKTIFSISDRSGVPELIAVLHELKNQAESEEDKTFLEHRISLLTSGIGKIYVGGDSQAENTRTKHLVEDAVLASIQALRFGVVPGGGRALEFGSWTSKTGDGVLNEVSNLIYYACQYPLKRICGNPHLMNELIDTWAVIDARTGEAVNAWEAGILDPASVPATALTKAFSVVEQLLLSEVYLLVEETGKKEIYE